MKKKIALLLTIVLSVGTVAYASPADTKIEQQEVPAASTVQQSELTYLQLGGWDETVKSNINAMFDTFGKNSPTYDSNCKPYAVFDFDNTISILDIEEILAIYQLEHMRFAVKPEEMFEVLITGIPEDKVNTSLGEDYLSADGKQLSVGVVAQDAAAAYKRLYDAGYVSADNSNEAVLDECLATDDWKEFASKMRWMYDAIGDNMNTSVSYPWITYWFTGMTPDQVYELATESHQFNITQGEVGLWLKQTYAGPEDYDSFAGPLSITYKYPVGISDELRELVSALDDNGFDVWICSASFIKVIEAAAYQPELFGLKGVDGVLAMENKVVDGVYDNDYNYDLHSQTQGIGKTETIQKVLLPKYNGHGPVFTAMDSQGDFNFCSEFKDTAVTLILNRQRTDDAGILSAVAVYQKNVGVDLATAQAMGDTLYVLQGRDENQGILLPQAECINLGKSDALLLAPKAEGWYRDLASGRYASIGDFINNCVNITGKLETYDGYKTK